MEKKFPEQVSVLPFKNKIKQCFSQDKEDYNKIHSKIRIVVEHTISKLKKHRLFAHI
ncbi:MAG TPA: transposase family protein [Candidatus Nitrosocosmicus sp.]